VGKGRGAGIIVSRGFAAVGQVLKNDARLVVVRRAIFRVLECHVLAVEELGHLAQGVVLHVVGFIEGRNVGEDPGQMATVRMASDRATTT
jgi:hypothetical protein